MTNPSLEECYATLAFSLHGSLDGINWRQEHPEACRGYARKDGLNKCREFAHKGVALQESKNARVRCGVTET